MEYVELSTHMTVRAGCVELFKEYADGHFMTVYGDPSQPLLDLLSHHKVGFKWFTFMEGLERQQ